MRKMRKLNLFGILGLITIVLFLIGISFIQAQVQIQKKPQPPPEDTWAVQLPTSGNTTMLYGDESGYYEDQIENIEVIVEKNSMTGPWRKDNDFVTKIVFKISTPTERYVNFESVPLFTYLDPNEYDYVDPDYGKPCCVFPLQSNDCPDCVSNDCAISTCMHDFINGVPGVVDYHHPYTDYAFFAIEIHAFDHSLTDMESGEEYKLGQSGHEHDYIHMELRYQTGDTPPTYHNILCSKSAHLGEASVHPFNIWITRTGDDTWTIDVGTEEEGPQFLFIREYYYEKTGKGKGRTESYSTLFQGGDFHFTFDLKRIPPAQ